MFTLASFLACWTLADLISDVPLSASTYSNQTYISQSVFSDCFKGWLYPPSHPYYLSPPERRQVGWMSAILTCTCQFSHQTNRILQSSLLNVQHGFNDASVECFPGPYRYPYCQLAPAAAGESITNRCETASPSLIKLHIWSFYPHTCWLLPAEKEAAFKFTQ